MLCVSPQACGSRGKALLEKAIRNNVSQSRQNKINLLQALHICLCVLIFYSKRCRLLPWLHSLCCRSDCREIVFCPMLDRGEWRFCMWMVSFYSYCKGTQSKGCYDLMHTLAVSEPDVFPSVVLCSSSHSRWHHMSAYCLSLQNKSDQSAVIQHKCAMLFITERCCGNFALVLNVVSDVLLNLKQLTRESFNMKHKRTEVRFNFANIHM